MTGYITDDLLYHDGKFFYESSRIEDLILNEKLITGSEYPVPEVPYYSNPEITWQDVRNVARDVPIVANTLEKYRKFIFQGARINVIPPVDEDVSEDRLKEVQATFNKLDRIVKTLVRLNQAWYDRKVYGSAIFEYVIGSMGGWKAPVAFKRLPAYSFNTVPLSRIDMYRYIPGDILKGIIYDTEEDRIEYWQKIHNDKIVRINNENVIHIRDVVADSPDGRSAIACIVPLVKRLMFAEKSLVQAVNRAGAPNLWISIEEYRDSPPPMNPEAWTVSKAFKEAKKLAKNHGKDTVMVAPSCIQPKPLDYKMPIDPMKVIDHYERRILYSIIARDFTEQTGQAISQTAKPGLTLLILMAKSEQEEIAAPFIEFWKKIFDLNGLDGWSVEIEWRPFEETSDEMMYRNAEIAAKIGAWTEDEIREIAGWPPKPKEVNNV